MHVVGSTKQYPLAASAQYKPNPHSLVDYSDAIGKTLGVKNAVLVQPSIYGTDNQCLIDALRELTPAHGRGVVEVDPHTIPTSKLQEWHELGVRGLRLNLKSVGKVLSEQELQKEMSLYADVCRPLNLVLEVFLPMDMITHLESIVPDLGIKVCIDHYGAPDLPSPFNPSTFDPHSLPGFSSLLELLKDGQTWVKISAPYRLTKDPQMRDLEVITRMLIGEANDRLVYATDWPHTRFENIDPKPFAEACIDWCDGDHSLVQKLFKTNAEELWEVEPSEPILDM